MTLPEPRRLVSALMLVALLGAGARAQEESVYRRLLEEKSPAVVTIKCVLKVKSDGEEQEMESENIGVLIDEKGLVLCSNSRLGGVFGLARRLFGGDLGGMSINPTDIKVIVGEDPEGLEARFVARDTELDLAWVQIKEPGKHRLVHVDLSRSSSAQIGQTVVSVYRMSKSYDHAAVVMESLVGGVAKKPRELFFAGDLSPALGLPAFRPDGTVVGISILQIPDSEEEGMTGRLNRMANSHEYSGALLPIAEVIKATARARESAQTQSGSGDEDGSESATRPASETEKDDQ